MQPTEPNIKRKNRSPLRVIVNQWGCLLGFVMLGLGAAMGLLGAIFIGPELLGFDLTATTLMEREIVLAATEVELDVREQDAISQATSFALNVLSTQAVLNNEADLLGQTATQSSQNIIATNTASAVQNVQRQTQVANDFASTQAALNANATQIDIDFRNTQAALGITSAQSEQNVAATPLSRYNFDFSEYNLDSGTWQTSDATDWQLNDIGLLALHERVWLLEPDARILSNYGFENVYTIEALISPATVREADYWILFAVDDETGLGAYFHSETLSVTELGLYRFALSQLEAGLNIDTLTVLQRNAANMILNSQTRFAVQINGESVSLLLDDEIVLQAQNVDFEAGAIGVQLPAQATLLSIAVNDQ